MSLRQNQRKRVHRQWLRLVTSQNVTAPKPNKKGVTMYDSLVTSQNVTAPKQHERAEAAGDV